VPFITTALPEIARLVKLFGLYPDTAHIAAALTYTVVVAVALRPAQLPLIRHCWHWSRRRTPSRNGSSA
jgi:hypothetical protein